MQDATDGLAWDDIALFARVARAGSLARAAHGAGCSEATLSRRMTAFERAVGRRLFQRGSSGYAVTGEGRELLARTAAMEKGAAAIEAWRREGKGPARVRVSAGHWTSQLLARNLGEFWSPDDAWRPDFVACDVPMDIARREIDIGVRNRRPEQSWLAGRRTAVNAYAPFARDASITGWIGPSEDAAPTPSAAWVRERHGHEINVVANETRAAVALAEGGAGRVVLPVFAGEALSGLVRVGGEIAELRSEEWLVGHHEARHDPAIRAALDAIGGFLAAFAPRE